MYHRKFTGHGENGSLMRSGSLKCLRTVVFTLEAVSGFVSHTAPDVDIQMPYKPAEESQPP